MIVYLNLDEVIRIIREHDDAKERMVKRSRLSECRSRPSSTRACARCASSRRWRSSGSRRPRGREQGADRAARRPEEAVEGDRRRDPEIRKAFGRRPARQAPHQIGHPPAAVDVPLDAMVEREPVTVLCSTKGWIRAVKGHNVPLGEMKYKRATRSASWCRRRRPTS